MGQAVRVSRIVPDAFEPGRALRVEDAVEAAALRPHPQAPLRVLEQHVHCAVGEGGGVLRVHRQPAERPALRRQQRKPVLGAHPQTFLAVDEHSADLVRRQRAGVRRVVPEGFGSAPRRVDTHQSVARAHPQATVGQRGEAPDAGIAQPELVARRPALQREGRQLDAIQATYGSHPQPAATVFGQGVDAVVGERARVLRVVAVAAEGARRRLPAVQAAAPGAHPEGTRSVLVDGAEVDVGELARLPGREPAAQHPVTVVTVEPSLRAEPEEALTVLEDAVHGYVRQAVLEAQPAKAPRRAVRRGGAQGHRDCQHDERPARSQAQGSTPAKRLRARVCGRGRAVGNGSLLGLGHRYRHAGDGTSVSITPLSAAVNTRAADVILPPDSMSAHLLERVDGAAVARAEPPLRSAAHG